MTIGRGVKVGGGAAVTSDLPAGISVNGYPAIPLMLERRIAVLKQRLPGLFHRVEALEEQVKGFARGES
jgi:UDP-3-O-[3-hydroxymyristoyl] glucosamine N-acyltransferase